MHSSLGPVRKVIHPLIYASVALNYAVMEIYIKCRQGPIQQNIYLLHFIGTFNYG